MRPGRAIELAVPAGAEIVIEGHPRHVALAAIDATMACGREAEFELKCNRGADDIDLAGYFDG